jgi:hypothetical protein
MLAGLKAGNFLLQPRKHFFHEETAKGFVAGVVLLAGLHVEMVEKSESDGRQRLAVEQVLENGKDFHLLQIEFAIEKKAEAMGLTGGTAQQMKGTGITHGRI